MDLKQTAICAALLFVTGVTHAVPIDVSSQATSVRNLAAGTYEVSHLTGAWSKWAETRGCDGAGGNCATGWFTADLLVTVGDEVVRERRDGLFASVALAAANPFETFEFVNDIQQDVLFGIDDTFFADNRGAIAIDVALVDVVDPDPEPPVGVGTPSTSALLALGLLGGLGARRRIRT